MDSFSICVSHLLTYERREMEFVYQSFMIHKWGSTAGTNELTANQSIRVQAGRAALPPGEHLLAPGASTLARSR